MRPAFDDTDAWILCAITLAEKPASLARVLWVADYLNVGLPTPAELNGAITRLGAAGMVRRTGDTLEVSDAVHEFHERWGHEAARKLLVRFRELLGKVTPIPSTAPVLFTEAEVVSASQEYSRAHRKTLQALRPNGKQRR